MNLVLDSSVWIDHLRTGRLAPFSGRVRDRHLLWCTSVSAAELIAGCRSKRERRVVARLLAPFQRRILTPAHSDFLRAAWTLSRLREEGQSLRTPGGALLDALQAACALKVGALLVTHNLADFRKIAGFLPVRVTSYDDWKDSLLA